MDLIEILNANFHKLTNKDIVKTLWMEMLHEKRSDDYLEQLVEYSFHYPVDSDSYLQELNQKFDECDKEHLRTIDGRLKAYFITFLYYCTNRFNRTVPLSTTVLATNLYVKLISLPNIGKYFFESSMFKIQLYTVASVAENTAISDTEKICIIKSIRNYCLEQRIETVVLKSIMNTLIAVMVSVSKEEITDIKNFTPLQSSCLKTIRDILDKETDGNRIRTIVDGLFKCMGKSSILQKIENKSAGLNTLKLLLKDVLQEDFDEDKFQYILDAFCLAWGKEDFEYYKDTVTLMNVLKLQYYKELIRKMVLYTQSKNHRRFLINIMNLLVAIAEDLPSFSIDKIQVLYSCAMRNVLYHFMDNEKKIVDEAILSITKLCSMNQNILIKNIFNHINCTGKFINLSLVSILLCVNHIADEKWGITPRNQNLLLIISTIIIHSSNIESELVQKTLQTLCKECTPYSLKPSLNILNELFCVLSMRGDEESAETVLKIIFKCAMHQDATSKEYAEHIFFSMLKPTVIEDKAYPPKCFFNIFLTTEFEYEALFTKCQKNIQTVHVKKVIKELKHDESAGAVLLCCLLNFNNYEQIDGLVDFFIDNFTEIATRETMGPLSIALRNILHNMTVNQADMPKLDVLHGLILEALFQQAYQVPSIKPAYDLLQEIRLKLKIAIQDEILDQLLIVTSERAFRRLHRREIGDHSVIMYLNELCLLMKKPPTENVVRLLEAVMEDPIKVQELNAYMPDIYLQLLSLFTTLAMTNKKKVHKAQSYLEAVLSDESQITKVMAFKLYYALCQEMIHEFEEVIKFAFREMVVADPCLLKLCAIAVEELVYDDYIKLDAQTFFKFIHILGSDDLGIFMKELLMKRFMLSSQNDIAKYYVQTIMYMHVYSKFAEYPISSEFFEELVKMKLRLNNKKDISLFLFNNLAIKKKFNILYEISEIFDEILRGTCKFDKAFFVVLKDLLMTFRFISNPSVESKVDRHYYKNICKFIETTIVNHDTKYQAQCYYSEYEHQIKKCTLSLLKLVFLENQQLADQIQITLFDSLIHWIDFVKDEIINYIHVEKGKDYAQYFYKLIQYYNRNKGKFITPDR